MKREDAIGLFGIAMWLLGVLIIGAGQTGVFDQAKAPKPVAFVAEVAHGRCTSVYPRGVQPTRITKKRPLCHGGDIEATWGTCTLRYSA